MSHPLSSFYLFISITFPFIFWLFLLIIISIVLFVLSPFLSGVGTTRFALQNVSSSSLYSQAFVWDDSLRFQPKFAWQGLLPSQKYLGRLPFFKVSIALAEV